MLPQKEFMGLLALLSDEDKSFELLIGQFQRLYPKSEQFKVCCCIYFLLKDNILSKITSRLVSLYILYEIYKNDKDNLGIAANPFFPIFLDVLQNPHSETLEKNFVIQLIGSQPPKEATFEQINNFQIFKKNSKEIANSQDRNFQLPIPDLVPLKKNYIEKQPIPPNSLISLGISPLVFQFSASDPPPSSNPKEEKRWV